jgi:hypothetical protein
MAQEVDVILFGLETSQDLRIDFPELADNEAFKNLKPKEVKFCWLVGNRTSPIFEKEDQEKFEIATKSCFPNYYKKEELKELYNGNIPDNIQVGIDAMKKFNPELRLRAKMLQHYIFDELNYIIGMKTRQQVLMMDNDELQKYSNLLKNIEKDIPNMLKRIEDGNGIKTVERGTKKRVLVNINDGITSY